MNIDTKLDLMNAAQAFANEGGDILIIALEVHNDIRNGKEVGIETSIVLASGDKNKIIDAMVGKRAKQLPKATQNTIEDIIILGSGILHDRLNK